MVGRPGIVSVTSRHNIVPARGTRGRTTAGRSGRPPRRGVSGWRQRKAVNLQPGAAPRPTGELAVEPPGRPQRAGHSTWLARCMLKRGCGSEWNPKRVGGVSERVDGLDTHETHTTQPALTLCSLHPHTMLTPSPPHPQSPSHAERCGLQLPRRSRILRVRPCYHRPPREMVSVVNSRRSLDTPPCPITPTAPRGR